jgi:hypothetical protein
MRALTHEYLFVIVKEVRCFERFRNKKYATKRPDNCNDTLNDIKPVFRVGQKSTMEDMMALTYHLHPAHPATPFIYKIPNAISPPKAPESADAMKRYAIRIPSSSLVYQLHKNSVIVGNKQPSKKPRKMRVVTKPAKFSTKPVQRHVIPQQNVIVGITLLNWRRLTSSEVGNWTELDFERWWVW